MKMKISVIFVVLLFFGTSLVLQSSAKTTEKKSNDINNTKMLNSPPIIDSVEYLGCRRSGSEFIVSFLVKASDSDGCGISISYRKSEFDIWWNYPNVLPSPASFIIGWNVKKGSYTAHFKACDGELCSEDVPKTFNVPKPRARTSEFINSLQNLLNIHLFERFLN